MKVKLSSGIIDTDDVTNNQVGRLITICSFLDNCIEDGDLVALDREHMNVTELMVEIGLTPAYMRECDE
tara:strand:+ start:597 stop:803 length:207 start_codon:yes stop_codon:yes gene_type:complete